MTNQELFDVVAQHLLTQGRKATAARGEAQVAQCSYRGDNGLRCAIGCLIPDELYDPVMEGAAVNAVERPDPSKSVHIIAARRVLLKVLAPENWKLAANLQRVHDINEPAYWAHELKLAAHKFELDASVVERMKAWS